MPSLAYTLGLDASGGIAGLSAMRGALSGFTGLVGKLGPLLGLAGGLGVAGAAAAGFKKAIDEAAEMEGFETGFKTLLGTAEAATERMRDLAKFAADTPFELPEIAQASRTLETLTKGALSTGKGLTLVGDVASGTQQPFGELAVVIGRLYDGLQSGRPVGEAMARLQELGVISGETRGKIEALQASGKKGADVWEVAAAALGRFSGMMKEQSGTWTGLMSTLKDGVNAVFREFGTPILPQLKPLLGEGIALTETLAVKARAWGAEVGAAIAFLRNAGEAGKLGEVAGLSLKVGFADAVSFLGKTLSGLFAAFTGPNNIFAGLGNVIKGLSAQLSAAISTGIAEALSGVTIGGLRVMNDKTLANVRGNARDDAGQGKLDVKLGLAQLRTQLGSGFTDFIKGATEDTAWARYELAMLGRQFGVKEFFGPLLSELQSAKPALAGAGAAAGGPAAQGEGNKALSDRLAKIGLFIGGSGGVRGEKAAQDTARHTGSLVAAVKETNRLLATPRSGSATF